MKLSLLTESIAHEKKRFREREISSLCIDSRISGKGDLFFCFRGTRVDSHKYAKEAANRGVEAIVCERDCGVDCPQIILPDAREGMARLAAAFYHHPERKLKIIGITGTNGKTTTAHLLYSILKKAGKRVGIIGTLGAKYGERRVSPDLTTPDPLFLFSLLNDMAAAEVEYVVMEVSAHALALKKVCPIQFEGVIFTNLTHDHLDFFHTLEAYGEAKKLLFAPSYCKFAVLNADDAFSAQLTGVENITYGLDNPADSFAVLQGEGVRETLFWLNLSDELCECRLKMAGRHNVYNALAAATCAKRLGVSPEEIARGISGCKQVDGRLEYVATYRGADIFVDFAHTPDGLEKSLSALKKHCRGKLYCLFGCGGNRDAEKRPVMGETVAKCCDFAILTSDNPRYEDPCSILYEIEQGYKKRSREYVAVQEREKATAYALRLLEKGDILLVAGKGGETYQEIMGIKYAYNDKDVIKNFIAESL